MFFLLLFFDNFHLGYFGGITSFSEKQFRDINGFPNNFWGWGGEDDELYKRTKKVQKQVENFELFLCFVFLLLTRI